MRMHLFVPSLFALFLAGSSASAQIKLAVFNPESEGVKNVVFEEASQPRDFQHGRLVRISLKGDDKAIRGTVVRVDGKSGRIFVRTQPGMPPRAFDEKDIVKIEKGTIKQVAFTEDVTMPEIQPIVIMNGTRRTVSYSAATLSPGEISVLRDLEASENALQDLEFAASQAQAVHNLQLDIQNEQRRTLELQNELLRRQIDDFYYYQPYGFLRRSAFGNFQPGGLPGGGVSVTAINNSGRDGTNPTPAIAVSAEALTKARLNYTNAQNRLVYESGRLVAVVVDDVK